MDAISIHQLRQAIPKHCFERSTKTSIYYVFRDFTLVAALSLCVFNFIPSLESSWTRTALWQIYGFAQGLVGVGIWILAHECGHGAFSPSQRLNDLCGLVLHSTLLVPYHSWRITHHRHHSHVAHMDKDTVFVPARAGGSAWHKSIGGEGLHKLLANIEDTPAVALIQLVSHQLFGWPGHMLFNLSAGKKSAPDEKRLQLWNSSHFLPSGGLFTKSQLGKIVLSDCGLASMLFLLYTFQQAFGWQMLFNMYITPWFWVHHWLSKLTNCVVCCYDQLIFEQLLLPISITPIPMYHISRMTLGHSQKELPALSTANSGSLVNTCSTTSSRHMCCIISSRESSISFLGLKSSNNQSRKIPFYNAREATRAIQSVLGSSYHKDSTNIMLSLWNTFRQCRVMKEVPSKDGHGMVRVWAK
jgi:hypothetical protein